MKDQYTKYEDYLTKQLKNPKEAIAYLQAAAEEDKELFLLALQDVIKAMTSDD